MRKDHEVEEEGKEELAEEKGCDFLLCCSSFFSG
jgi:hypothetical protein